MMAISGHVVFTAPPVNPDPVTDYVLLCFFERFPFLISVKEGCPTYDELEELSREIEHWKPLGRRLNFTDAELTAFQKDNVEWFETAYAMLRAWKTREGSAGSYRVLYEALCHGLVCNRYVAEKHCCYSG